MVPLHGVMPVSETVDRVGPIARSAKDCAIVLDVIADTAPRPSQPAARPRIGVIRPDTQGHDRAVIDNLAESMARLGSVFAFAEAELPDLSYDDVYRAIIVFEATRNFSPLIADGTVARLVSPDARDGSYLAGPSDEAAYREALARRETMEAAWHAFASSFDALLTATNPRVAPPANARFSDYFGEDDHEPITTAGALLGLPAITVPSGLGARDLPTGIQFVGKWGDDAELCALAQKAIDGLPQIAPPVSNIE